MVAEPLAARRSWRTAAVVVAAVVLWAWAGAHAGTVRGRVVHGQTGRPVGGLEVRVLGMEAGKPSVEVVTRTDSRGTFQVRLEPARRTHVVQATYQGVTYTAGPRPASDPSPLTLRVFEATRQAPALWVSRRALLLEQDDGWFVVREVVVVHNPSPRTYVGSGGEGTWRVPLLVGAEAVQVVRGMVPAGVDPDGSVVDTLPVQPGDRAAVLVYRVRARGPSLLQLRTGLPTASLDVFAAEPLQVRSELLEVRQTRRLAGRAVTWRAARDLAADAVLILTVEGVPARSPGAERLASVLLAVGAVVFVAWPWWAAEVDGDLMGSVNCLRT